jgi:DNA replication and repair protein RecF
MNCFLEKLQSKNFRNLSSEMLQFGPKINCIFGENGNGKTNILELIHFITNSKSFRKNAKFNQILNTGSEDGEIQVQVTFNKDKEIIYISGKIFEKQQFWYQNNTELKKIKITNSIFINPFDSNQFHNSSSFRRSMFDNLIGVLFPEYKRIINQYESILRSRNKILVTQKIDMDYLNAYQEKFENYNYQITFFRKEFIAQLNEFITETFNKIFSEQHFLEIRLTSKIRDLNHEEVAKFIRSNREKEITRRITYYGVHRDDYVFHFDGFNSYEYCSLGQQKMAYLSLLFAYIELFRYKFNFYPIVLIDDVSGELDSVRWLKLIQYLEGCKFQTFITTANEAFKCELEKINSAKKIYINDGSSYIR